MNNYKCLPQFGCFLYSLKEEEVCCGLLCGSVCEMGGGPAGIIFAGICKKGGAPVQLPAESNGAAFLPVQIRTRGNVYVFFRICSLY